MQKEIQSNNTRIFSENENITLQNNELNTVTAAIAEQNRLLSQWRKVLQRKS